MVSQSQGSEGSYTTGGGGGSCCQVAVLRLWSDMGGLPGIEFEREREREREREKQKKKRKRERESINRQMRRTLESWLCDSGGSLRSDRLQIIVTVVS